jgi:apoptogenic protein 1
MVDINITPTQYDLIGPFNKLSNLRKYKFYIPEDETAAERKYRIMRVQVYKWNQTYWSDQNIRYSVAKKAFMDKAKSSCDGNSQNDETSDDYAELLNKFNKKFLDENFEIQLEYNRLWFKYNIDLLWPAFLANIFKTKRKLFGKK